MTTKVLKEISDGLLFYTMPVGFSILNEKDKDFKKEMIKKRIIRILEKNRDLRISDISEKLEIPLDETIKILNEMEREGIIKSSL